MDEDALQGIYNYRQLTNLIATVEFLGMRYIYIPVAWEQPRRSDCAANKRVSVFMALYRRLRHDWAPGATLPDVQAIWEPDAVWRQFMEEMMQQLVTRHSSA